MSRGAAWPDAGTAPFGATVILSAEDALDDTIRPRLDRLGADTSRIHALIAIRDAAFVAAARLVLAVAPRPDDETRRVVAPLKSNICAPAPSLAFVLDGGDLRWQTEPVTDIRADALLAGPAPSVDREQRTEAAALLRELLRDREAWPMDARDVYRLARGAGIAETTVRTTARRLGVVIRRAGFGRGGRWVWHPPYTSTTTPIASIAPITSIASMPSSIDAIHAVDAIDATDVRARNGRACGNEEEMRATA